MMRNVVPWTVALLVGLAANGFASDGKEAPVSHTISLWGGNTPAVDFLVMARDLVGARYQLHVPLGKGHHWTVSPGLGYGYGSWKDDQTSPAPNISPITYQVTASYWDAMLDFLYYHGGCDDKDFYCGPGLFYSSLTLKDKTTGMPDVTYNPNQTFGAQLTVGGGIAVGRKLQLTGSMTERAGKTSFDRKATFFSGGDKFSAITYSTQFSVGLGVRF